MKFPFASTQREDNQKWFISFLKTKESELISESGCRRVKTQEKVFYCEQGKIIYNFVYVQGTNGLISPLREYLGIGKYQNMSLDFKQKLIMKASRTTYQKAIEDIHDSFEFWIAKKTLNRYVIKDRKSVEICTEPEEGQDVLVADSTKVRNGKKGHHEVFAAISLNYHNNTSSLTAFAVNKQAKDIAKTLDLTQYKAFVGDADLSLRNFFKGKMPFQLCHQHAIRDVSINLWKEGMKKKQRDPFMKELEEILYTLQNSTKKYWKDNNTKRLVNRIINTKKRLRSLAAKFSTIGMFEATRYLMDHIDHIVTAANMALLETKVPWTTNHAERLMQEIGVRTKKKGMNWTEDGLKAMLNIVLRRYFLPKQRRTYKEIMNFNQQVVET